VGPNVKPLEKAKSSQQRIPIYKYAIQHVALTGEIQALGKDELTEAKIFEKISGSRQKF